MSTACELTRAQQVLESGGIVAMPTESVYGLHCLPQHLDAIKKILQLKQRSPDKGLILIAGDLLQLDEYISPLSDTLKEKIVHAYPVPTTWVVPARSEVSRLITGQFNTVAVRITRHPFIARLCQQLNSALISTSANISQQSVAHCAHEIKQIFPEGVDLIIEGKVLVNTQPSQIIDIRTGERLR